MVLDENSRGLMSSIANPDKGKMPSLKDDANIMLNQIILMTAVGLPKMIESGFTPTTKDALYEAGLYAPQQIGRINKMVESGEIEQTKANEMIAMTNTMANEVAKVQDLTNDAGLPLTIKQKRDIAVENFRKISAEHLNKNGHDVKASDADKNIKEILADNRFEPADNEPLVQIMNGKEPTNTELTPEEIQKNATEFAGDITDENQRNAFLSNVPAGLKEAAQQLHGTTGEAETANKFYGKRIADLALDLYPTKESTEKPISPTIEEPILKSEEGNSVVDVEKLKENKLLDNELYDKRIKELAKEPSATFEVRKENIEKERKESNDYYDSRIAKLETQKSESLLSKEQVTKDDFFIDTKVTWGRVKHGQQAQELFDKLKNKEGVEVKSSPRSQSQYIIDGDKVYRFSDHWGNVASTTWHLDKPLEDWQMKKSKWVLAEANLSDFKRKNETTLPKEQTPPPTNETISQAEVSPEIKKLQSQKDDLINQRDNPPGKIVDEHDQFGEKTGKKIEQPLSEESKKRFVDNKNKQIEQIDNDITKVKTKEYEGKKSEIDKARDEGISKAKTSVINLNFIPDADFLKSTDPREYRKAQKEIRKRLSILKELVNC